MKQHLKNMLYERALEKAMRYCSYQERCRLDLTNRFIAWNVKKTDWDRILNSLSKEDFLNEHRYVEAFVRGKFRMKKWGKNKIKMGLIAKQVYNEQLFNTVFESEIEEKEYLQVIRELLEKKSLLITEKDGLKKRDKLFRYLLSKGYESDLISKELAAI